jgi:hypothetical protein
MSARIVSPTTNTFRWLVLAAATLAQATASFVLLGLAALWACVVAALTVVTRVAAKA